jgi:signal transduction histidine kinase
MGRNKERKTIIQTQVEDAIDFAKYQQTLSDERLESELIARINEAHDIAMGMYNKFKGSKSDKLIKGFINEALRNIRFFNGRGYFYVYEMNGLGVMHGANPKFEGNHNIYNFTDAKGMYPLREVIKTVSKHNEGFVKFWFFRPNITEQEPKLSYNKFFKPYNWVIGIGEYKREVIKDIQKEKGIAILLAIKNRMRITNSQIIQLVLIKRRTFTYPQMVFLIKTEVKRVFLLGKGNLNNYYLNIIKKTFQNKRKFIWTR